MMSSGTHQPSLLAGAARPTACAGTRLDLGFIDGTTMPIHGDQAWTKVWTVSAYSVANFHRFTPRPSERSP
jgi:hypothetical protein